MSRHVQASVSRGGPGTGRSRNVMPGTNILRRIGDRDIVVANDDLTKDNVLHYNRGKIACKRCGEPRMPSALTEEGVCRSLTVCIRLVRQEEELMASTLPVDWRHDDSVPPQSNDDVARVMKEEGLSRRRAYEVLRRRRAAEIDISSVSEGQRVAVLGILINDPESRKDVHTLIEECHAVGVKIDGHDVTKTLFALQHQGFVRFRERNRPRTLYAIVVTNAGHDAWLKRNQTRNFLMEEAPVAPVLGFVDSDPNRPVDQEPIIAAEDAQIERLFREDQAQGFVTRDPKIVAAIENARLLQQEVNALGAGPRTVVTENYIERPWRKGGPLEGWPMFAQIRDRFVRARKLNAAAKLLEEAGGQDEMVLTLMGETEFTPLEEEVLEMLKKFGEIE